MIGTRVAPDAEPILAHVPLGIPSPSQGVWHNSFRLDGIGYIFNLATKALSAGTYQLCIDLGDGVGPHHGHQAELPHAGPPIQAAPQVTRGRCLLASMGATLADCGRPGPALTAAEVIPTGPDRVVASDGPTVTSHHRAGGHGPGVELITGESGLADGLAQLTAVGVTRLAVATHCPAAG